MTSIATHKQFLDRGIILHNPDSITLDLAPEQIAPGVEVHAGCRIRGCRTSIGPGCRIGVEAPATLINCQLGKDVRFFGGFAEEATLLDGVSVGSGAHIRPGTLLEEYSSCAHTVGLKQTLLMPYVTLGSLINFCDCLMAGGTGPKDHSEVGSSYIHFNFTAHQDKATPSLIGDVPAGVMLDRPPIFLGGQGGLAGPVRIAYGSVLAAGTICRRDVLNENMLIFGQNGSTQKETPYKSRQYGNIDRICRNNVIYIGNLHALAAWYRHIRTPLTPDTPFAQACLNGALRQLAAMTTERCDQLEKLAAKIAANPSGFESHRRLLAIRPHLLGLMSLPPVSPSPPASFLTAILRERTLSFMEAMKSLPATDKQTGTGWLQQIVNNIHQHWEKQSI